MKTKTNAKAGSVNNPNFTKVLDKTSPQLFAPDHNQAGMRASTHARRLLGAGLAMAAGLFGQAAFAQSGTVFRGSPLACNTSAGPSSFAASSWSLAVDPNSHEPTTVTITKPFDGCSAALYKMANPGPKGSRMKSASITVRAGQTADAKNNLLLTIEMENVGIGNYVLNGGTNTETITLTFTGVSVIWP